MDVPTVTVLKMKEEKVIKMSDEEFYKHMEENILTEHGEFRCVKEIFCCDGFHMSVQCSKGHYCSPRETLPFKSYSAFEVGFPSKKEDLIMKYVEDESIPTKTVYGGVPLDTILKVIDKHGGIKVKE